MPVREARLLEREGELEELLAALEDARAGRGGLVVVEGVAGIGKTRLLAAARETADRTGMRVLRSRGSELERDFPFALVRQLFEPALMAMDAGERAQLLAGAAAPAAAVFGANPEEGEQRAGAGGSFLDPSFMTLNALYWLTSNLADSAPLALAVDDAHWADEPSLSFLGFMFPRLEELPVALVLAARPPEPRAGSDLLARLTADSAVPVVRPRALSREAVSELVRAALGAQASDAFCAACHQAAGGNPFMTHELLVELAAGGSSGAEAEATHVREVAPAAIQRAVLVRLGRLPDPAPALARAVGVLGDDADPRHAAGLAGLDSAAAAVAADALAAAGILEPGRPWRFTHPLVRNGVYRDLSATERAGAHRQAARLLEDGGAEPERIAVHLLATEPAAETRVVETLGAAAARALERLAPETAVGYLRRALAEPAQPGARPDLLRQLVMASYRASDWGEFESLLESGVFEQLTSDRRTLPSADHLAFALVLRGRHEEAVALLERATTKAAETEDDELVARFQWFALMWAQPSGAEMQARLDRFDRDIEPDTPAERVWLTLRAQCGLLTGEPRATVAELARRALEGGKVIDEQADSSAIPAHAILILVRTDELDAAERAIDRNAEAARALGTGAADRAGALWLRSDLALARGDVMRAEVDARAAVDAGRQGGFLLAFPPWTAGLVLVLVERDELAAAEAELAAAGMGGAIPPGWWFSSVLYSRARLRVAQGREGEALEDLLTAFANVEAAGVRLPFIDAGSYAALALSALGQAEEARRLAAGAGGRTGVGPPAEDRDRPARAGTGAGRRGRPRAPA